MKKKNLLKYWVSALLLTSTVGLASAYEHPTSNTMNINAWSAWYSMEQGQMKVKYDSGEMKLWIKDQKMEMGIAGEVDTAYIEAFKSKLSTYENPYKVIDEDFKNSKINKPTWQKAWLLINETKKSTIKETRTDVMEKSKENRQEFKSESGTIQQFIRTDLSADEKKEFVSIMDSFGKDLKVVSEDKTLTPELKIEKIKSLNMSQYEKVLKFVIVWKEVEFKTWIEARTNVFEKNQGMRQDLKQERKDFVEQKNGSKESVKQEVKARFKILTQKTVENLNKKFDSIPVEQQELVFNALITRIDTLIEKTTDLKKKTLLTELKQVMQDKVKALNANIEQDSVINELLNTTVQ